MASNRNAERLLISAVLRTGDIDSVFKAGIEDSWFRESERQWHFIMSRWRLRKRPPGLPTFKDKFPGYRLVDADDIDYAIDKMKRYHAQQTLLGVINDMTEGLEEERDFSDIIGDAHHTLVNLQGVVAGRDRETEAIHGWKDTHGELVRRNRLVRSGKSIGLPTGWDTVDTVLGGWQPGHLIVIGARLNVGKSWAAVRTATEVLKAGGTVQFHTLEMLRTDVSIRFSPFLARAFGSGAIKASELSRGAGDLRAVKTVYTDISNKAAGRLIIDDTPRRKLTPLAVASKAERNKPDLIIIDYLQLMSPHPGDWAALAQLSGEMKDIAVDFELPVIVLSQLNRTVGTLEDAGAEALSGADAIGHDADFVLYFHDYSKRTRRARVIKNRHGDKGGRFYCEFDVNVGIFDEVSKQRAEDLRDEDKLMED